MSIEEISRQQESVLNRLETLKRTGSDSSTHSLAVILSKLYADLRSELGAHEMHMDRLTNLVTSKLEQDSQSVKAIKAKLDSQNWAINELNQ